MASPEPLPVVCHDERDYYFDARLRQLRNVNDPHDFIDLADGAASRFMCCGQLMDCEAVALGMMGEDEHQCSNCGRFLLVGQQDEEEFVSLRQNGNGQDV